MTKTIQFVLNGCDISLTAEAPADMTLEQLLTQADRIIPDWCACGICSTEYYRQQLGLKEGTEFNSQIKFDYDDVWKKDLSTPCKIKSKPPKFDF